MKKNIAIIFNRLGRGGAERIAGLLSYYLSEYYNVYLFLSDEAPIDYQYGGEIVQIGGFFDFDSRLERLKRKYSIDVSISFMEYYNFANIRTKGNDRVIISERNAQSMYSPRLYAEDYRIKRLYPYADSIVACSYGVKYDLQKNYGIDTDIRTIYNFINQKKIIKDKVEKIPNEIIPFLGESPYFVNEGRLASQKNQKYLIAQFAKFHSSNDNYKLVILGSGMLRDELNNLIISLHAENYIKIFDSLINPFSVMSKAKAFVLSSSFEGLPNVILEAMCVNIPILSIDCLAGPRELLDDVTDYEVKIKGIRKGKRGILVDKDDEQNGESLLSKAMYLLISNSSYVDSILMNQRIYMEKYSNEAILKKWIDIIEGENGEKKYFPKEEQERKLNGASKIVIYGCGEYGTRTKKILEKNYYIDCFVISSKNIQNKFVDGLIVKSVYELDSTYKDALFVMGVFINNANAIITTLESLGYTNILFPYF